MFIKKFAAVFAAALIAAAAAPSVLAEYDYGYGYDQGYNYDYNNYDYNNYNYDYNTYDNNTGYDTGDNTGYDTGDWGATTTTAPVDSQPAETAGNAVTSMGQTTKPGDKPTSQPSRVYLQPGEIQNGTVAVELRIEADADVTTALMSVSFDTTLLQLENTVINEEIGGKSAENSFNGKYVFNYTNEAGSKFKGKYVTMNFKVLDPDMVSTTLFLTVTTLDSKGSAPISYSVDNGMISNPSAPNYQPVETEAPKLNKQLSLPMSKGTLDPAEVGIQDYRNIVVADTSIVSFEEGLIKILAAGQTTFDVVFNNNDLETYDVIVVDDTAAVAAPVAADTASSQVEVQKSESTHKEALIFVAIAIVVGIMIVAVEYFIIMKPVSKRSRKLAEAEAYFDQEYDEEDDEEDMKADLQKAFAARDARRKAALGIDDEDEDISEEDDTEETDQADEAEEDTNADEETEPKPVIEEDEE